MSDRTIVITGGAGFIGSHVVRLFVRKYPQYRIINLDKLTYAGNLANLKDIEDKYGKERVDELLEYFDNRIPESQYEKTARTLRLTAEGLWFADGIAEDAFIVED